MKVLTFATIDAPATDVWDVLADFPSYDQWNPVLRGVSGRCEAGATIRFHIRVGPIKAPISAEILEARRGHALRWVGPAPRWSRRVASGEHYFSLTALSPTSTRLEHGEDFRGLLVPARFERAEAMMRRTYDALNRALALEVAARA